MLNLDAYAYSSKLRALHPIQKLFIAFPPLLFGLWVNRPSISIVILLSMCVLVVGFGRTSFWVWLKLMTLPAIFLTLGLLGVLVEWSSENETFTWWINMFGFYFGVTPNGLNKSFHIGLNALAAVSCLYFLALTTPLGDLLRTFYQLKVPKLICELMSMMYRFIFLLIETAETIHTAQVSRLSNATIKSRYRSFSTLVFRMFVRSHHLASEQFTALESRGYQGELTVLNPTTQSTPVLGFVMPAVLYSLIISVYFTA